MESDKKKTRVLIAIIIVGFCLRPSITGLGSVLKLVKADLALSDTASGLLTTLPMITFAAISPFVGKMNNKFGTSSTLSFGFVLIAVGVVPRSFGGLVGLYVGTILLVAALLVCLLVVSNWCAREGTV